MITKQTVFILGAGASAPYGFPLGKELVDRIKHELNPQATDNQKAIDCICKAAGGNFTSIELEKFRKTLEESRETSIDAFLQHHDYFMSQGRYAIAWVLLNAERKNRQLNPIKEHKDKDWYPEFRDLISATHDKFQNNKTAILTFNYDRSLEQFLITSLRSRQQNKLRNDAWAEKLRECLPIIHLHGELGIHPAFSNAERNKEISFGQDVTLESLRIASKLIRNVHDEFDLDSDPAFQKAYGHISRAEFIFFLGFSYDMRNVKKLRLDKHFKGGANIYGTGLDLTNAQRTDIQIKSNSMILRDNILQYDCFKFLRECYQVQTIFEQM